MPLHDYNLANQTPASYRTDHNNLNQSIATNNYSSSGITTTFQTMWYANASSSEGTMQLRNTGDSAFHTLFLLDSTGGLARNSGDPNGSVVGRWTGQKCYDTSNDAEYTCTTVGSSSEAGWSQVAFSSNTTVGLPAGYIGGPPPVWLGAATIQLPGGFRCRDDSDSADISFSTAHNVVITNSGAGGLSSDLTEAADTWYHLFAIRKSGDGTVNGILTNSSSGPVLPSGYDQKAYTRCSVRNSSDSDFLEIYSGPGWPLRPLWYYRNMEHTDITQGQYSAYFEITSNPTIYSSSAVTDNSGLMPVFSREFPAICYTDGGGNYSIRPNGSTGAGITLNDSRSLMLHTSTDQKFQVKANLGGRDVHIGCHGYVITEGIN